MRRDYRYSLGKVRYRNKGRILVLDVAGLEIEYLYEKGAFLVAKQYAKKKGFKRLVYASGVVTKGMGTQYRTFVFKKEKE